MNTTTATRTQEREARSNRFWHNKVAKQIGLPKHEAVSEVGIIGCAVCHERHMARKAARVA